MMTGKANKHLPFKVKSIFLLRYSSLHRQTDKVSVFALPLYLFAAWLLATSSSHKYPRLVSRAHICPPCIWLRWQHLDTLLASTLWACSTLITWLHHLTCPVQDTGELTNGSFFCSLITEHASLLHGPSVSTDSSAYLSQGGAGCLVSYCRGRFNIISCLLTLGAAVESSLFQ